MNKVLIGLVVVLTGSLLGGCYYEPGYSYVRGGGGDAYYGRAETVYDDGYYAAPGYYDRGYYGNSYYGSGYYTPGCCYSSGLSVGVGTTWYGGSRRGHDYRRGGDHDRGGYRDRDDHRGHDRSGERQVFRSGSDGRGHHDGRRGDDRRSDEGRRGRRSSEDERERERRR